MRKSSLSFIRSSESKRRYRKIQATRTVGAVLCVLLSGIVVVTRRYSSELQKKYGSELEQWISWHPAQYDNWLGQWLGLSQLQEQLLANTSKTDVLQLMSLSPQVRISHLEAITQQSNSQASVRARYILANDLIQQQLGKQALGALEGLEQDYPILAPYIVLKRAQAYELTGNKAAAVATWQDLLKRSTPWLIGHPDNPVAAESLFVLGQNQPKYWDEAIAYFPSHPRTLEIVRERLKQKPHQRQLLLLLAKYGHGQSSVNSVLNQLVKRSIADQLRPEDWEVIAFNYWENKEYDKAATAYARATNNPHNAYRIARGRQLSNQPIEAVAAYIRLLNKYPYAPETGSALLELADMKMLQNPEEALSYVDLLISRFPNRTGAALLKRATIVEHLNNPNSAAEARELLLSQYGHSDAAAEYRWNMALAKAATKDYRGAWHWAQQIPTQNPNSPLAPRAGFWLGKWALALGWHNDAQEMFENVLAQYPHSYYAWRSAAILGLNVGSFTTVRQLAPEIVLPTERPPLTAGSTTLKELYQMGQDQDASTLWQAELTNPMQLSVAEQYTDGLIRLARGEVLVGIDQISSLEDRQQPQEQAEYQALRQQLTYWQARYPFPFFKEVTTWSKKHHLNPLLVTALIRQESRFEPKIRSKAGAVGLMQVMPESSKWVAEQINLKHYSLENPNDNIELGTWFLDFTHKHYQNNSLLAVASYNAGPGNVSKWVDTLGKSDPDEFVEAIPFDETKNYVRQVFSNYWNYLQLYNPAISRLVARYSSHAPKPLAQARYNS